MTASQKLFFHLGLIYILFVVMQMGRKEREDSKKEVSIAFLKSIYRTEYACMYLYVVGSCFVSNEALQHCGVLGIF